MRNKYMYLVLGTLGILNTVSQNIIGLLLANVFGSIGLFIGIMFSTLSIPLLIIGWYFSRKEKYTTSNPEPVFSKYSFYLISAACSFLILYSFTLGLLSAF